MPFAFVQFTRDAEAQEALDKGKGALVFGRPCRTEMVKANRTFVIQKKTGPPITVDEAERALLAFGQLSKCELLHPQLREPLGYPPTVLVEFSMFDATRDLHTVSAPGSLTYDCVSSLSASSVPLSTSLSSICPSLYTSAFLPILSSHYAGCPIPCSYATNPLPLRPFATTLFTA